MARQPYTIKDLMRIFDVAEITVTDWRRGSSKRQPIPHTTKRFAEGRSQVRISFDAAALRSWLYRYRSDLLPRLDAEEKRRDEAALSAVRTDRLPDGRGAEGAQRRPGVPSHGSR